jgi:hypothetical protein
MLAENGYRITLMDSKIDINLFKEKNKNGNKIEALKENIVCDELADGKGTDISKYDFVIGFKPCEATEHVIRQCLKQNKPFILSICNCVHQPIIGNKECVDNTAWINYLNSISNKVKIVESNNFYYATNLDKIHTGLLKMERAPEISDN